MRRPDVDADRRPAGHPDATHVLLDLDGTISDSSPGIARSLRQAFETCGYAPPTDDQVRTVIGPPFEVGLPRLGVAHDDVARVADAYRRRYEDVGLFENEVYPGVVEMLDQLAADGHVLSVATAKPEVTAVRILEHFGLASRFWVIAGASAEVGVGRRTKAAVITHALGVLGLDDTGHPDRRPDVVMVGDRDHDVHGASANDIACIGVSWGFGSVAELEGAGAVAVIDHPVAVAAAVGAALVR